MKSCMFDEEAYLLAHMKRIHFVALSVHVNPARGCDAAAVFACNYHKSWTMKPFRPQWGLFSLPLLVLPYF